MITIPMRRNDDDDDITLTMQALSSSIFPAYAQVSPTHESPYVKLNPYHFALMRAQCIKGS